MEINITIDGLTPKESNVDKVGDMIKDLIGAMQKHFPHYEGIMEYDDWDRIVDDQSGQFSHVIYWNIKQ